jgi:hypothetical protein
MERYLQAAQQILIASDHAEGIEPSPAPPSLSRSTSTPITTFACRFVRDDPEW